MFYMMCERKWIETRGTFLFPLYNVVVGKTRIAKGVFVCVGCVPVFLGFFFDLEVVTHGHGNKAKFSRALIAVFFCYCR